MITQRQFKRLLRWYGTPVSILFGALLIAAAIYFSLGPSPLSIISGLNAAIRPNPPSPAVEGTTKVSADDDEFLGSEQAPVLMIEFGDFQCPFCRDFWRETLPRLKSEYIDTGRVKFVYRDYPLSFHPAAQKAAEAAECARDQGLFWEMHDKLFAEQDRRGEGTAQFGEAEIKQWAREIGVNITSFNTCLESGKYTQEVQEDFQDGLAAGVTGTPTFFVGGQKIVGALSYSVFLSAIEDSLNNR